MFCDRILISIANDKKTTYRFIFHDRNINHLQKGLDSIGIESWFEIAYLEETDKESKFYEEIYHITADGNKEEVIDFLIMNNFIEYEYEYNKQNFRIKTKSLTVNKSPKTVNRTLFTQ